ncbi:MAG: transposase [Myxococcales bacterium]|nr:transposase [Myxococcales bacterium]
MGSTSAASVRARGAQDRDGEASPWSWSTTRGGTATDGRGSRVRARPQRDPHGDLAGGHPRQAQRQVRHRARRADGRRRPATRAVAGHRWPDDSHLPSKYSLATLPRDLSRKQLVRAIKERWRTERAYEDLKGELGLDHFEGRSYQGWHHHVTVVLCCFAFLAAERARAFSPSRARADQAWPDDPLHRAA